MEKFNFEQVREQLQQTKRELIVLLSNQAQNYFLSSFRKQGWDGKPWEEVQRRETGTKAYKYPKGKGLQRRTSPILVGAGWKVRGGTLRRAVSNMARTAHVYQSSFKMIVDLPYAAAQNDGTRTAGRGHNTVIPERRFVGQTTELTEMQEKKISQIVDKIWKVQ